jgi:hypothetical protein
MCKLNSVILSWSIDGTEEFSVVSVLGFHQ